MKIDTRVAERLAELPPELVRRYRSWPYNNTGLLVVSLIVFWLIQDQPIVQQTLTHLGGLGYLGAFVAGIFFVSIFTIVPAAAILSLLAATLNPGELALAAGFGAMLGDYLIFRFLKDKVYEELSPLLAKVGGNYIAAMFRTPYFAWLVPAVGALVVASPLPDEVGIGLLGASKLKSWQFLILVFILNAAGILSVIYLSRY